MAAVNRPRPEHIRALIDEADRVFRETESTTSDADHTMKQGSFWPERRKTHRRQSTESVRGSGRNDEK